MMLSVKIDSFKYENCILLKDIEVKFKKQNVYCIVGENGSGKTTFLNIITTLIPTVINGNVNGKITYDKKNVSFSDIDYVFQNSENSLFYNKAIEQLNNINSLKLNYWLNEFNMLNDYNKYIRELSIGQKKIVTCLMALLSNRPICILDEPSTNLDDINKKVLIRLINKVKKEKIIIIVSHDKDIINISDVIYRLNNKCLKKEIIKTKKNSNIVTCKSKSQEFELLKINGFKYKFDNGNVFICDKYITINRNSITAILGNNGCGKTTFANYIIENYKKFHKNGISKNKITCSIMFQTFYKQLFEFSIKKELLFGLNNSNIVFNYDEILKEIGLSDKKNEDPRFISDGQKRILLISSLLMSKKDLIILDEPFDNIDDKTKLKLKKILIKYRDNGSTIIILDQTSEDFYEIVDNYIEL